MFYVIEEDLFKKTNTAKLSVSQIKSLPTHRLKSYRKKLIRVIAVYSQCECCGEPFEVLYPDADLSFINEVIGTKASVNAELRNRSETSA